MKNYKIHFLTICLIVLCFGACKNTNSNCNYINYYNESRVIDSLFLAKKDTLQTIASYKKLFSSYEPKNINQSKEYETLVKLIALKSNDNIKDNLMTLVKINAPIWKYTKKDKVLLEAYKKNNIDSSTIANHITKWDNTNSVLLDSLRIVFKRFQKSENPDVFTKDDELNEKFLTSTFKKYGYPSSAKITSWYNENEYVPISQLLFRMTLSPNFKSFRDRILEYVKSGDCSPQDYAEMIDKYNSENNLEPSYGFFIKNIPIKDTLAINKNRKLIGIQKIQDQKILTQKK